jgi:hypothetical protein
VLSPVGLQILRLAHRFGGGCVGRLQTSMVGSWRERDDKDKRDKGMEE